MIKSDGVGVSIILVRVDKKGIPVPKTRHSSQITLETEKFKKSKEIQYIEDQPNVKEILKEILKKIHNAVIDPNKGNLMYCMSDEGKKFRYTQAQRGNETRKGLTFKSYNTDSLL